MARGGGATVRSIRAKGTKALAWASFGIAFVGGTFAAGMWIGGAIDTVLDVIPWGWVSSLLLVVAVVGVGIDLVIDLLPNKVAIWGAILIPSIATAAPGKLGDTIDGWAEDLAGWLDSTLVQWVGDGSSVGLALTCIVCSLLMARRVVTKAGGAAGGKRGGEVL